MTTERDIHNQLVYARDKGLAEGLEKGREEGINLMAEQLRKAGMSEDEVRRIIGSVHP